MKSLSHIPLPGPVACVGYARVSTAKQAQENISIAVQLEECRKYARARGWTYLGDYVDPGVSGRSEQNRPQLQAMLEEAGRPNPPFQVILVYDHSRLFRNTGLSEVIRSRLRLNGVTVQSTSQNVEDDGLSGSLAITIQAAVDDHQSRLTAVKVRSGMEANARAGFYPGGNVPYGYKLKIAEMRGSKAKHKLVIEPAEAKFIESVFELQASGLGAFSITRKLNEEGFRTRSGKKWCKSRVSSILKCETYAGRHLFRPTDWRTQRTKSRNEWVETVCPAIVDEATFQNAQRLLRKRDPRTTPPRITSSSVLLGGIALCGFCGGRLQLTTGTGRNKTVHRYYKCATKLHTGQCPGGEGISIPEEALNSLVVSAVITQLITSERVQEIVARAVERQSVAQGGASDRIKILKKNLTAVKRQEANLWDLGAELGLGAANGFRTKLDALQEEALGLSRQIAAEESQTLFSVRALTRSEAAAKTAEMQHLVENASPDRRRRFIHDVVRRVVVGPEEIRVEGPEATLAQVASAAETGAPPVHGFEPEWLTIPSASFEGIQRSPLDRRESPGFPRHFGCRARSDCAPRHFLHAVGTKNRPISRPAKK